MTPRTPLPKAALAAVGEAQQAAREAAQLLRGLLRAQPHTTDLAAALALLARAETRLSEAARSGKEESMEEKKQARQVPSIGRVVHYVAYGTPGNEFPAGAHRAAIITAVLDGGPGIGIDSVSLCVLNPTGMFFHRDVPEDPSGKMPGTWHWPEYVPAAT